MRNLISTTILLSVFLFASMASGQESRSGIGTSDRRSRPEPAQANSANIQYDLGRKALQGIVTDKTAVSFDSRTNTVTTTEDTQAEHRMAPLSTGTEILTIERKSSDDRNFEPAVFQPHFSMVQEQRSYGYGWYLNYGWADFHTLLTNMGNSGFRIENIDTYGKTVFDYAGTWTQDGLGWAWGLNQDYNSFVTLLTNWPNGTTRYRPIDFAMNLSGAQMSYGAVAVADNLGFGWTIDRTSTASLVTWINSQYSVNRRLVEIGFYTNINGNLACCGISKDAGYAQQFGGDLSWNNFVTLNTQYINQGYRLVDYDKYNVGGTFYYAGLWNKDGIGYAYTLDYSDLSTFTSLINTHISQGFKPIKVDVYDADLANDVAEDEIQPYGFHLQQNFPNPFNPSTTIRYELPKESFISLRVFNLLGEDVATLVEGTRPAGVHAVQFDASKLVSGVYFYRLQAGEFVETKEMILLK
jgi:hypothetical protein